jgi:hypothetical protein
LQAAAANPFPRQRKREPTSCRLSIISRISFVEMNRARKMHHG